MRSRCAQFACEAEVVFGMVILAGYVTFGVTLLADDPPKHRCVVILLGISNFSNPRVEHLAPSLQCEFVAAQNRHCDFTSDHIYHVHVGWW